MDSDYYFEQWRDRCIELEDRQSRQAWDKEEIPEQARSGRRTSGQVGETLGRESGAVAA